MGLSCICHTFNQCSCLVSCLQELPYFHKSPPSAAPAWWPSSPWQAPPVGRMGYPEKPNWQKDLLGLPTGVPPALWGHKKGTRFLLASPEQAALTCLDVCFASQSMHQQQQLQHQQFQKELEKIQLLHQQQLGLELVALLQHVPQLLEGEARAVGISQVNHHLVWPQVYLQEKTSLMQFPSGGQTLRCRKESPLVLLLPGPWCCKCLLGHQEAEVHSPRKEPGLLRSWLIPPKLQNPGADHWEYCTMEVFKSHSRMRRLFTLGLLQLSCYAE